MADLLVVGRRVEFEAVNATNVLLVCAWGAQVGMHGKEHVREGRAKERTVYICNTRDMEG